MHLGWYWIKSLLVNLISWCKNWSMGVSLCINIQTLMVNTLGMVGFVLKVCYPLNRNKMCDSTCLTFCLCRTWSLFPFMHINVGLITRRSAYINYRNELCGCSVHSLFRNLVLKIWISSIIPNPPRFLGRKLNLKPEWSSLPMRALANGSLWLPNRKYWMLGCFKPSCLSWHPYQLRINSLKSFL